MSTAKAAATFDPALPVKDLPWGDKTTIENQILGTPPNWDRYRRAHLWSDPKNRESKAGYKLPFARMEGGSLVAIRSQLSAAIAALNGARGGVAIPDADRKAAYALAVRYLKKFDPKIKVPELKGKTMQKMDAEGFLNYAKSEITKAKQEGDGKRLVALKSNVDLVVKAKADGDESVVIKGFEGSEEFEIQVAARMNDGKPALAGPNDDASATGQGIAENIGELAKQAEALKKGDTDGTTTSDESKPNEGKRALADDEWPDDMAAPDADGPDWGNDPA